MWKTLDLKHRKRILKRKKQEKSMGRTKGLQIGGFYMSYRKHCSKNNTNVKNKTPECPEKALQSLGAGGNTV